MWSFDDGTIIDDHEVANLLERAADLIEHEGWSHGLWRSPNGGGYCAEAAINIVATGTHRISSSVPGWQLALCAQWAVLSMQRATDCALVFWNDAPGRTEQEVLDTLRAAAKDVEARAATRAERV